MKTTMSRSHLGFILAAFAATVAFAADEAPVPKITDDNPAAKKPSPEVSKQLNAALPKYDPNPAPLPAVPAEPKPGDPIKVMTREDIARAANPDNADVLVLPTLKVQQKPRPRLTPDLMATSAALAEDRLKKSTQLDQALNKFTLPLFGVSAEERAREERERAKKQQLNSDVSAVANALDLSDPAAAKELRNAAAKP